MSVLASFVFDRPLAMIDLCRILSPQQGSPVNAALLTRTFARKRMITHLRFHYWTE